MSKPAAQLKPHPFADLLPAMSDAEYGALKDSIARIGQTDPIVLYQGKILDGRHRYRACNELERKPKIENFNGDDQRALDLVYAKANHRNMSDSQKACAAVGLLERFRKLRVELVPPEQMRIDGKTRDEMQAHLRSLSRKEVFAIYAKEVLGDAKASDGCGRSACYMADALLEKWFGAEKSRDKAGSLFGVSGRYVQAAETLLKSDSKLFREVFEGRLPITRATRAIQRKARRHEMIRKAKAAPEVPDCEIIDGDSLKLLKKIPDKVARLIIADPPYNIGIDYGQGAMADQRPHADYMRDVAEWLGECNRILTDDGSLFIICDASYLCDFEMILGRLRFRDSTPVVGMNLVRRNVIAWHETFGSHQSGNFTRAWRPILYYTKSQKNFVWNADEILEASARLTEYGDKRADPAGKVPTNVWEFPRVVDNAKTRSPDGFATQLPIELTNRIVKVASDPGDLVIDPFTGSGTSAVSAIIHGRRFKGFEIDAKRAEAARLRVRAAVAERQAS